MVRNKRGGEIALQRIWWAYGGTKSRCVNQADLKSTGKLFPVFENGPAADKVDLLVIGEGYPDAELPKFQSDLKRLLGRLFETEPYKSRKRDFNVRALQLPASQSGVHRPRTRDDRRTPISPQY